MLHIGSGIFEPDFAGFIVYAIPIRADWDGSNPGAESDEENAIDEDTSTYALLDNPATAGQTKKSLLLCRLPTFDVPGNARVQNDSIFLIGKFEMENNPNGSDLFQFGLEPEEGTEPTGVLVTDIVTAGGGDNDFNNIDGADSETALSLDTSDYVATANWDPNSSELSFPLSRLSDRRLVIICQEEDQDTGGGGDDSEYFRIYEARLRVDFNADPIVPSWHGHLVSGYDDDASGTYTGSANSLIETPCDVLYFLLGEYLGLSGFDTSAISTARTDLGAYIIAGQIMDRRQAERWLSEIAVESKLILFQDFNDEWSMRMYDLPASSTDYDKAIEQDSGHFVSEADDYDEVSITHTATDEIYNQFEVLWQWSEGEGRFVSCTGVDESTAGAIGTWLTDSQSDYGVTRKLIYEARWLNDSDSVDSFINHLIYRYADISRIVTFVTHWYGIDLEVGDRVQLTHQDITDTDESGGGDHIYEVFDIRIRPMDGIIVVTAIQVDRSHSALSDPT